MKYQENPKFNFRSQPFQSKINRLKIWQDEDYPLNAAIANTTRLRYRGGPKAQLSQLTLRRRLRIKTSKFEFRRLLPTTT